MRPTSCLICPADPPATEIFPQSADVEHLAGGDFAARKTHQFTRTISADFVYFTTI